MTCLETGTSRRAARALSLGMILALAAGCLLAGTSALAQKKTAKEAEALSKSAESAKQEMGKLLDHLGNMLEGYNAIVGGSAKKPQTAYKSLVGDLKSTEKMIEGSRKSVQSMDKDAQKFFKAWEKDAATITQEGLREKSLARLEASRERYGTLGKNLTEAADLFAPVVQALNDQILYLGRDLSPEALADLQDEAAALNKQAEEVSEKVRQLLAEEPPSAPEETAEPAGAEEEQPAEETDEEAEEGAGV